MNSISIIRRTHKLLNQIADLKPEAIIATVPDTEAPSAYKAYSVKSFIPCLTDIPSKIKRYDPCLFPIDYEKLNGEMLSGGATPGAKYKTDFIDQ